jgi:hypothetical protein
MNAPFCLLTALTVVLWIFIAGDLARDLRDR